MYLIFNEDTGDLHFNLAYDTLEEAIDDLYDHLELRHYEYGNNAEFAIHKYKPNSTDKSELDEAQAIIVVKKCAWLEFTTPQGLVTIALPKHKLHKRLPSSEHVVVWESQSDSRLIKEEFVNYGNAANAIATNLEMFETQTSYELLTITQEKHRQQNDIFETDTQIPPIVRIKKSAWVTYTKDEHKHKILLPLSKRFRKKLRKKYKDRKD